MEAFLSRLSRGSVLVSDGAMGTVLAGRCASPALPEELLLTDYGLVRDVHRDYVSAGAEMITTNTFGAGALKLSEYGLEGRQEEIVARAVSAAREAAREREGTLVAGSVGPLGSFMLPFGSIEWDEAVDSFAKVCSLLAREGVDLIAVETMTDLRELRAAALAARREAPAVPLLLQMSFDSGQRSVTGTPVEAFVIAAEAMRPDAIGSNCGGSLEAMSGVAKQLGCHCSVPFSVQPNAGLPELRDGLAVFPALPGELADLAVRFVESGAAIVGSCCGSTPEHTREIRRAVEGMPVGSRERKQRVFRTASRTTCVSIGAGLPFVPVGERINPSGRKRLREELLRGRVSRVRKLASRQVEAGAGALDINLGIGDEEAESRLMVSTLRRLGNSVDSPVFIDSPFPSVMESGLREHAGSPVLNSVSGEPGRLEMLLDLAVRFGAGIVALLMDERGVRETPAERLSILERILAAADRAGLPGGMVLVDPVVLPLASSQSASCATLEVIRDVGRVYGLPTVMGLSNVSFGLPARGLLNRTFLAMAIREGLDAAILDPLDSDLMHEIRAAEIMAGRDADAVRFVSVHAGLPPSPELEEQAASGTEDEPRLSDLILQGSTEEIEKAVASALADTGPMELVDRVLIPTIRQVGDWYERGEVFLPQLMASANAVQAAFDAIRSAMPGASPAADRGTVLLATVEGDVHDIGKNIIRTVLAGHGYRVVDLGKNVPRDAIVEAIETERPLVLGLSALLTPSLVSMRQTVEHIRERASEPLPRIIVGGAVVTGEYAAGIGALYAADAIEAARIIDSMVDGADGPA
ncbi:homocysteine S-methyltransferase family protein [Candidatus Fermentibacterales bacterium]|nr:homocysteine S-methyltransferase family protein [Candidatus Fermentibacterales bacterium]